MDLNSPGLVKAVSAMREGLIGFAEAIKDQLYGVNRSPSIHVRRGETVDLGREGTNPREIKMHPLDYAEQLYRGKPISELGAVQGYICARAKRQANGIIITLRQIADAMDEAQVQRTDAWLAERGMDWFDLEAARIALAQRRQLESLNPQDDKLRDLRRIMTTPRHVAELARMLREARQS